MHCMPGTLLGSLRTPCTELCTQTVLHADHVLGSVVRAGRGDLVEPQSHTRRAPLKGPGHPSPLGKQRITGNAVECSSPVLPACFFEDAGNATTSILAVQEEPLARN